MSYQHAIVDDADQPSRRQVCQKVGSVFYYSLRYIRKELKGYALKPKRPVFLEDFGFEITDHGEEFYFEIVGPGFATYADGRPREWQGEKTFFLPKLGPRGRKL